MVQYPDRGYSRTHAIQGDNYDPYIDFEERGRAGMTAPQRSRRTNGGDDDEYDIEGYHIQTGYHRTTGYHNVTGLHRDTGRHISSEYREGRHIGGYAPNGRDCHGYNRLGYSFTGRHRSGFDGKGFDHNRYHLNGRHRDGYTEGRDIHGFDIHGYDSKGFHRFGFGPNHEDINGYRRDGFHRKHGFNRKGFNAGGLYNPMHDHSWSDQGQSDYVPYGGLRNAGQHHSNFDKLTLAPEIGPMPLRSHGPKNYDRTIAELKAQEALENKLHKLKEELFEQEIAKAKKGKSSDQKSEKHRSQAAGFAAEVEIDTQSGDPARQKAASKERNKLDHAMKQLRSDGEAKYKMTAKCSKNIYELQRQISQLDSQRSHLVR